MTSLKALRTLRQTKYSPFARGIILWIEITALEQRKPELYRRCCVAIWSTENNVQTEVLVAAATFITFVVRCLETWSDYRKPLTPSSRKTVEPRQSRYCFVSSLARWVMNSIITSLSVFLVVKAIQTSPSDAIPVIILIFWLKSLSGAVFRIPRRFQRLW